VQGCQAGAPSPWVQAWCTWLVARNVCVLSTEWRVGVISFHILYCSFYHKNYGGRWFCPTCCYHPHTATSPKPKLDKAALYSYTYNTVTQTFFMCFCRSYRQLQAITLKHVTQGETFFQVHPLSSYMKPHNHCN
jgi:hypothetical protein